ncbi:MAG: RNA pseudouridine synthase [Gemmataceae bacterium]|nr:RNA pseudouridine synthase [Gemmataceae bacterium]
MAHGNYFLQGNGIVAEPALKVLFEDNHLLVLAKPPGLPTAHGAIRGVSLFDHAKDYLKHKYNKPGNVYLGLVHRLDQAVSGVVVFARTSKAAARLCEQFRLGTVQKTYLAATESPPAPPVGTLRDFLQPLEAEKKVQVSPRAEGAKEAITEYQTLLSEAGVTLVKLHPRTGRKHQLRVQLAVRGWPIVGDGKYGAQKKFPHGIALHGLAIEILHPVTKKAMTFTMLPPLKWLREFGPWVNAVLA